jgi:hypothetical protein
MSCHFLGKAGLAYSWFTGQDHQATAPSFYCVDSGKKAPQLFLASDQRAFRQRTKEAAGRKRSGSRGGGRSPGFKLRTAASGHRRLESETIGRGEIQRIGKLLNGRSVCRSIHTALEVADAACAQPCSLGQLLLSQTGRDSVAPEKRAKVMQRSLRHRRTLPYTVRPSGVVPGSRLLSTSYHAVPL